MKKFGLLLLSIGFFAVSCSSDDSNGSNNNGDATNFLPLAAGNYWVYDVPGSIQDGRDSLYVANDTVIGSNTYKKLKTRFLATGFFSGAMSNNGVRASGDELVLSGSAAIPFSEDFPATIAVSDFTIFKQGAAANTLLDEVSGTITQQYEGIPLNLNYELGTTAKENLATYSINNQTYTNVKRVETVLNLEITATIEGIPFPLTIMSAQDVVISSQYYAEGIGVVHVVTDFQYELGQLPFELPIPQTGSESQEEILVDYSVE
ncbi:hypothetical protein OGH69_14460 [Flavobacterium sp. MFBS3-15]|uniref:hypothetical protein n=1 Tax=Flavobacterium sp. MFBS3-15 TaxID=2989816 RepID=UPI002235CCE7|nr:hypothetical protein [Flavobacterium sp. MFBS3-15]MCW4470177.1 hypothetical protein [Flavobacterium sp. MFBS3-15]